MATNEVDALIVGVLIIASIVYALLPAQGRRIDR